MSKQIHTITEALAQLKAIRERIAFYNDGDTPEANCPQALPVGPSDFQALALILDSVRILEKPAFIAVTPYGWGKHTHPAIATKNAKKASGSGYKLKKGREMKIMLVHADTTCDSFNFNFPAGCYPIELKQGGKE